MSKKEFWDKQIVLKCPVCGKGYKSQRAMLAHFSRVHDAITHEKRVELYHKAIDNWNEEITKP